MMRKVMILALLALVPTSFMSCRGHRGHSGADGTDGVNGQDGQEGDNGTDGIDGLNGIGFDYVRGMDGAVVCEGAMIIPARFVVPADILALAPNEDPFDPDGLTLTFGTTDSPLRFYLGMVMAGEFCVVEKVQGEGWEPVGEPLVFTEPGFIAVVPPSMIPFINPAFLSEGRVVQFPEDCKVLNYSRNHLNIGKSCIRINFGRD